MTFPGGRVTSVVSRPGDTGEPMFLVTSEAGTAQLVQLEGRHVASAFLRHKDLARSLFLPNGARVATISRKGELRIWPVTPEAISEYLQGATTVNLSTEEYGRYIFQAASQDSRSSWWQ